MYSLVTEFGRDRTSSDFSVSKQRSHRTNSDAANRIDFEFTSGSIGALITVTKVHGMFQCFQCKRLC